MDRTVIGLGTATGAAGATAHTLGQKGGEETHVLTVPESPAHTHNLAKKMSGNDNTMWHNSNSSAAGTDGAGTGTQATSSVGGDQAHNNMQPYLALTMIIRAL